MHVTSPPRSSSCEEARKIRRVKGSLHATSKFAATAEPQATRCDGGREYRAAPTKQKDFVATETSGATRAFDLQEDGEISHKRATAGCKKRRDAGGKISQLRPQPGDDALPTAASNYQQTLGLISLNEETTLNASARQAVESRASSPTRTRNDLESAVPKIIYRMFTTGMAMREDVQSLRQKLMAAARHRGILPLSLKVRFRNKMSVWERVKFNLTSRHLGYIIPASRTVGPRRCVLSRVFSLKRARGCDLGGGTGYLRRCTRVWRSGQT
jgi:hypothetical protein